MFVHVCFILFVFICTFSNWGKQKLCLKMCGVLLFIILGFRGYDVGKDTIGYIIEYKSNSFSISYEEEAFEPGRLLFQALCQAIGLNSRGYLIFIALLTVIPLVKFIRQFSVQPCFTFLFYLTIGNYTFNLTGIRQTIALSIITFGLYIAFKKHSLRTRLLYVVIAIVAAHLMHKSALALIILIPLLFVGNISQRIIYIMVICPPVLLLFTSYISSFSTMFMIGKYESYESFESDPNIIAYFVIPYVIFLYTTYLFLLWKYKHQVDEESFIDRFVVFCFLCSWIYAMIASASIAFPISARLMYYINLPIFVLIVNLMSFLRLNNYKLLKVGIVLVCILFFLISTPNGTLAIDNYNFSFE